MMRLEQSDSTTQRAILTKNLSSISPAFTDAGVIRQVVAGGPSVLHNCTGGTLLALGLRESYGDLNVHAVSWPLLLQVRSS